MKETMAKQTKSQTAPAASTAAPANGAAPAAPATVAVVEKGNADMFVPVALATEDGKVKTDDKGAIQWAEPSKKVAPQAQVIINAIRANGVKGVSRKDLNLQLKGVLQTRQPESRIVTYYQKLLQEVGSVKLVKAATSADAPAAPAPAAA